jgi:hypothetical protein
VLTAKPAAAVSYWHHSVESLTTSILDFYQSIEMALHERQVNVQVERIDSSDGDVLSAKHGIPARELSAI